MNNLITTMLLSASLLMSFVASAEKIDRTLEVEAGGRIAIEIMDGQVTIEGWDKPQIRVVGDVSISNDNFTFKTDGSNTIIEHEGEHRFWNSRGSGSYADITIYAPRTSDFRIDSTSACLLYTSPSPRDQRGSRMPSSA